MITIHGLVAQGDILIQPIDALPDGVRQTKAQGDWHVVAHSETSHHHSVSARVARLMRGDDPLVCYLVVDGPYADLVHQRQVNPHETVRLPTGCYKVTRQREFTPEGLRMVQD